MGHLFGLFLVAIAIAVGMAIYFKHSISKAEFALLLLIPCGAAWGLYSWGTYGSLLDTEHWNGRITAKVRATQNCCHCQQVCSTCTSTDSKGNVTVSQCNCITVCDHSFDYQWALDTNLGERIVLASCDGSGVRSPRAWDNAYVGEPAVVPKTYTNYLLADPETLIRSDADPELLARVPDDIPEVHSHYKVSKVVSDQVRVPPEWQTELMEVNADLGPVKQVDILMVFTSSSDPEYADAVASKWLYGPKNAVIVVVGVPEGKSTFEWVRVVTLSESETLKIMLRDQLKGHSLDAAKSGVAIIRKAVEEHHTRTPMEKWAYLESSATPSTWVLVLLYLLVAGGTAGLGVYFHRENVL